MTSCRLQCGALQYRRLESEIVCCLQSATSFSRFSSPRQYKRERKPSQGSPKPTIGTAECRKSVRNCAGVGAASPIEPLAVTPPLGSGAASARFLAVMEEMHLTQPGHVEALPVGGSIKELPALPLMDAQEGGKQFEMLQHSAEKSGFGRSA